MTAHFFRKVKPTSTSAPTTENIKNNFIHISKLINPRQEANLKKVDISPVFSDKANLELATNGPYDNFNTNVELQDDPAALFEPEQVQEGSTIEPEKATTIVGVGLNPSINY